MALQLAICLQPAAEGEGEEQEEGKGEEEGEKEEQEEEEEEQLIRYFSPCRFSSSQANVEVSPVFTACRLTQRFDWTLKGPRGAAVTDL